MPPRSSSPTLPTPLDLSGLDYLLPDEDLGAFTQFRDALLEELSPSSDYQKCFAMNLVGIEWDVVRHRRLLAAAIRDEFRRQAEVVGRNRTLEPPTVSIDILPRSDGFGRDLLDRKPKAVADLAKSGLTRSEITAAAYVKRATAVAYHEGRIAELERRRRALLADYETLKSRRLAAEAIEDAVIVT